MSSETEFVNLAKRLGKDEHCKGVWYCLHFLGDQGSNLWSSENNVSGKISKNSEICDTPPVGKRLKRLC